MGLVHEIADCVCVYLQFIIVCVVAGNKMKTKKKTLNATPLNTILEGRGVGG